MAKTITEVLLELLVGERAGDDDEAADEWTSLGYTHP